MKSFEERERERETWSPEAWQWISFRRQERWCRCRARRRRRCLCVRPLVRIPLGTGGHPVKIRWLLDRISPCQISLIFLFSIDFCVSLIRVSFSSFQLINYFLFWVWLVSFLNQLREQVTHFFFFPLFFYLQLLLPFRIISEVMRDLWIFI